MSGEDEVGANVRKGVDEALDELQRMAGDIRLKIHLAGLEAKDKWKDLEPKVDDFEKQVETTAERAGEELRDLGQDLMSSLRKLRDDLKKSDDDD